MKNFFLHQLVFLMHTFDPFLNVMRRLVMPLWGLVSVNRHIDSIG